MRASNHSPASAGRGAYAIVALLSILSLTPAAALPRIHLSPKLVEGEMFRYRIETETTTKGQTSTPIVNPEAATRVKQTANLILRLNILDVAAAAQGPMPRTRVQITYEKSSATSESDAYDPQATSLDNRFDNLQGRSMEFTIQPDGKLSNITGLDDLFPTPSARQAAGSWMAGITFGARFPHEGIAVGQKWRSEELLAGSPLKGLVWRTQSEYLRDEPCGASNPPLSSHGASATPAGQHTSAQDACAVILAHFEIVRHGSRRGDATPDEYLHSGLRTSGTWTGHGQSLNSISIQSGLLVVSTSTVSQDMDYEIRSATSGSSLHYKGHTDSQSQIMLLPESLPSSPQP